jgi:hypothetical protein
LGYLEAKTNAEAKGEIQGSFTAFRMTTRRVEGLAVNPVYVEVEAGGGVADDLVDVAHGEVVGADVPEGGAG